MGYCEVEDVQAEFKNTTFGATGTTVLVSQVEAWILQADALINSIIGKRYAVPVTDQATEGFQLLKMYSTVLVSERVRKKLEVVQNATQNAQQNPKGVVLNTKEIMAALQAIAKGEVNLIGVGEASADAGFSGTSGFAVEPVFHKDGEEW